MSKLIYCATPSRIKEKMIEIMDFVTGQGYAPLHPFQALPYARFEGNSAIGRVRSMEYCKRLVDCSDELWLFGISDGTLDEVVHAITIAKPVALHLSFDPQWKKFYQQLGEKYGKPLDKLLASAHLL